MKTLVKTLSLILATIWLSHAADTAYSYFWNKNYYQCRTELIKAKNFQSTDQASECASTKTTLVRILGTLTLSQGTYL